MPAHVGMTSCGMQAENKQEIIRRENKVANRNFKKQAGAVVLSLALLLPVGCTQTPSDTQTETQKPDSSPAAVWYAPGTQKIRPDIDASNYSDVKMDSLKVSAGRYEYESAQIIMSATQDIASYDLTISDLTLSGDSSVKYSADNIEVYNQHYINVTKVVEQSPLSTIGLYPDALIPFDAAKEYDENTAKAGSSQGIWVEFYVPEGQAAGTYTGTFTLSMDGWEESVPVSLRVRDYDFASNYTARSEFAIDSSTMAYAELDSSQDMLDAYAEALLDYRLNPGLLMIDYDSADPDDMKIYARKAFEFAQDERVTTVFMPYVIDNGRGDTYLVLDKTGDWMRSFIDVSLESYGTDEQLNLVAKTMFYFTFVDEPTMNPYLIPRANRAQSDLAKIRDTVHAEYTEALEAGKDTLSEEEYAFRKEVIDSVLNIRNVLTGPHDERFDDSIEVYCPQVDMYDSEQHREEYVNDVERWWYLAVGPHYPYPTYHIDDTNLLSARLLSWMQADYGVVGNLYWVADNYNAYSTEEFLEDPYDNAMRYQSAGGANGDGFLFYPGNKYGVYGPIGTIRLQAIRDGLEEYEILTAIQNIYGEINAALAEAGSGIVADFDKVYSLMSENLYSGTSVYTTQNNFDEAYELLGSLAELASIGGIVSSVDITDENAVIQLILPDGCTVVYDQEKGSVTSSSLADGYKLYTFTQKLSEDANVFVCDVKQGDRTISFNMNLGGEIRSHSMEQLTPYITFGVDEMQTASEANYVAANTVDTTAAEGIKWLQLGLPAADGWLSQSMVLGGDLLMSEIGKETQKVVIKIYNDRDASGKDEGKYTYRLQFRYEGSEYYTEIRQDTLKAGYNEITIGNIFGYDWDETGALTNIRFYFGESDSPACDDLYFIGVDVYFV